MIGPPTFYWRKDHKVLEYTGKEPTWKIGDLITASLPGALNPEVSMYMYTPLKDGYSTIVDTK